MKASAVAGDPEKCIIEAVAAWQQDKHLRDRTVAERLGISRAAWQAIRTGHLRLGEKGMKGVARAFPRRFRRDLIRILEGDTE